MASLRYQNAKKSFRFRQFFKSVMPYINSVVQHCHTSERMLALVSASATAFSLGRAATHLAPRGPLVSRTGSAAMMNSWLSGLMGPSTIELVKPEDALPGRPQPMQVADRHFVLGTKMQTVPEGHKVAIFANGCFWGSEKGIWRLPGDGIFSTAVGYAAGFSPNPTYEECCSMRTGHTEAVQVVYDPEKISFVDIARWMWEAHNPTAGMSQGNDVGTQYRSGFYWTDDEQKELILASKAAYEKALGRPITTELAAAADYDSYGGCFFHAENYHQQYLAKPGARPYCSAQPQGVSLPPFEEWCPKDLQEKHAPKLPEAFWKAHAPGAGCRVVAAPNEPIKMGSW